MVAISALGHLPMPPLVSCSSRAVGCGGRLVSERVAGGQCESVALSYPELWVVWERGSRARWLLDHVNELRAATT
jgi:hypothetical protein